MDTRQFLDDHRLILERIERLQRLLAQDPRGQATPLANELMALSSKVRLHVVIEDQFVYPTLARSRDPEVARRAAAFQSEMGGLRAVLDQFFNDFDSASAIHQQAAAFEPRAATLLAALKARILREEAELYPLAGDS